MPRQGVWIRLFVSLCVLTLSRCFAYSAAAPGMHPPDVQQSSRPEERSFEVASLRPNAKWVYNTPGYSLDSDEDFVEGQDFFLADATVSTFIAFAYKLNMQNSMLENLPNWATARTVNIRAKIPGHPNKDQVREMMRTLLEERFGLKLHFEDQVKSVFALSLLKPGQLGPSLRQHASCKVEGNAPKNGGAVSEVNWLRCSVYLALDRPGGAILVAARNTTMSQLCAFLSNVGGFGRIIVDRTGVNTPIDFWMEYSKIRLNTDESQSASPSEPIESALTNQLGVKLSPMKVKIAVPIVDHLSPLTEN